MAINIYLLAQAITRTQARMLAQYISQQQLQRVRRSLNLLTDLQQSSSQTP
ncbi:hypothetical protein ACE1CI_19485 [Aerosakkonemataceae cyanobacterium BLCC-F50]|uniref:Uncharacterized protein n=1 Tax=Floridaenema flaviceps BLCC-F50 TaxID=3153642 RepID=A0ABV4XTQ4_9CYAN